MQTRSPQRFFTSLEIATACGVSTRTVSTWIREGAIPAHRTIGGHGRVAAEDLARFLSERGMPLPPALQASTSDAGSGAGTSPRRRRVLVIDDDQAFLSVVREFLVSSGYEVETAHHGFLAGYLAGHHRPDVVLLDIRMPGLDGYEVLSIMRRQPEALRIPVVACTSLRGAEVEMRIQAAGFDAYVRKPIDFKALLQLIERFAR